MNPTPFTGYRTTVRPTWLDYNGHMNDSAYGVVCTEANELFLEAVGLSASYRAATGHGMYTVEAHLRFLAEVAAGDRLHAETLLVEHGPKRLRVHTCVLRSDEVLALTGEYVFLHVDHSTGRVCPMPAARQEALAVLARGQAGLERPAHLGRGIR